MKSSHIKKLLFVLFIAISLSNVTEAKKKKKGQNPPKKKQKVPEKPKLRLVHWFGNMSDITYRCPATEYPNYKRIVQIAKEPITTVVDCSVEGARWDYDIKVFTINFCSIFDLILFIGYEQFVNKYSSSLQPQLLENKDPKRRDDFNGHGVVTFAKGNEQGKFKQGLKLGKCFMLKDEKIREIRGNFKDNMFQVI